MKNELSASINESEDRNVEVEQNSKSDINYKLQKVLECDNLRLL